jgi:hypothetical protein
VCGIEHAKDVGAFRACDGGFEVLGGSLGAVASGEVQGGFEAEVGECEDGGFGEDHGTFEGVFELADISFPGGFDEAIDGGGFDAADAFAEFACEAIEEVGNEFGDVFGTIAEGWHFDVHDIEAVVEVGAELSGLDGGGEVAVGGGEDAGLDADGLDGSDGEDLFIFDGAEELGLGAGSEFADFIEEEGAAAGGDEETGLIAVRAGVRAALMTEELIFEEFGGDGGAVDGEEGGIGILAEAVERAGGEFLSGAGFAGDEDGAAGGADFSEEVSDILHGAAVADEGVEIDAFGAELAAERGVFASEAADFERAGDLGEEFIEDDGFHQIIMCAESEGGDGVFDRGVGGDDEDAEFRLAFEELFEEGETIAIGELDIGDDEIGIEGGELMESARGGASERGVVAFALEEFLEGLGDDGLIINDEDAGLGIGGVQGTFHEADSAGREGRDEAASWGSGTAGRTMRKMEPPPGRGW